MRRASRPPRPAPRLGDGGLRDVAAGFGCLGDGLVHVARRPRLLLLGAAPALLTSLLVVGALAGLAWGSGPLAAWLTPFAAAWHPIATGVVRWLVQVLLLVVGVLLAVTTWTALTLALGGPFYDRLSTSVDRACGEVPEGASAGLRVGIVDALRMIVAGVVVGLGVLLVGLVPVVGQVAAPVLGAVAGGVLLVLELLQPAFDRRGITRLADRWRWVRRYREMALGFGIPVYLAMLVPGLAVLVFPAAVAGATLLARTMRGEPAEPRA